MSRLRDLLVVPSAFPTGRWNTLTDVPGVRVGHSTLIEGEGPLVVGRGPVRTGVTAIHPGEGSAFTRMIPAAVQILNGAGEITGRSQIDEYGTLESPILLTNTLSVGAVHRATVRWMGEREPLADDFVIPVVAETYDGLLNDIEGQHVGEAHVRAALDGATSGPVAEGNVGGGTGMALFHFKGGIGTASRLVEVGGDTFTVGVLVQGNFGRRQHLTVLGVPVGRAITDLTPIRSRPPPPVEKDGSIVVIIATDAPLSDRQLARLCRRGMLGIGRTGSIAGHSSGDLLLAFSNADGVRVPRKATVSPLLHQPRVHDGALEPFFEATIEATEESILNAMVAATTLVGRDGNTLFALPHDRLVDLLRPR